ncbi:MAG: hypothetical protein JWN77_768 [Frankiales bacterium]|nr:hypothetical protein [Frankiales bacterium]
MTVAEPVARCGFRLSELAEELDLAAARASVAVPAGWLGTAGAHYRPALHECERDIRAVASAYGQAGEALLPYARALLEVEALEQQARGLRDRASAETAVAALTAGVDEGAGWRLAADRLQQEARELERTAAARCAALLHELAARAPRERRATGAWRLASDAVSVGIGTVAGTAALASAAGRSLVGRHQNEARHELAEQALAMMRVWETPVQMWHDLLDGRPGLAVGAAPFLGRMPRGVIRDPHLAHREALREAAWRELLRDREPRTVTAAEMGLQGADLVNEELRGGHTLDRHIAATRGSLLLRTHAGVPRASTFRDLPTAQRLVDLVLRQNAARLHEVYDLPRGRKMPLVMRFPFETGRVSVAGSSRTFPCRSVRVVLMLDKGGQPVVRTAYPEL